jgi:hypothetical protein
MQSQLAVKAGTPEKSVASCTKRLSFLPQYHFHYSLLCRAAGLAIGCLAALPFLDSRCWQHPAPKQRPADTLQPVGASQRRGVTTGSRRDQGPSQRNEGGASAAPAHGSGDAATAWQLTPVPPLIVALGEHRAACWRLPAAPLSPSCDRGCMALRDLLQMALHWPPPRLTHLCGGGCRYWPGRPGDTWDGDNPCLQASWRSAVAPSAVHGIPSTHGAGVLQSVQGTAFLSGFIRTFLRPWWYASATGLLSTCTYFAAPQPHAERLMRSSAAPCLCTLPQPYPVISVATTRPADSDRRLFRAHSLRVSCLLTAPVLQGGALSSAAIASVMAAAVAGAGPAGRVLRLLLGGAIWKPLAEFSYSAYLYHEHVSSKLEQHGTPYALGGKHGVSHGRANSPSVQNMSSQLDPLQRALSTWCQRAACRPCPGT